MAAEEPPQAARERTRRLFFALWPDETMRLALVQATRQAAQVGRGRLVPTGNLHLTLAFLGPVPERRLTDLAEAAHEAAAAARSPGRANSLQDPVELVFDRLECWRAAGLLCARPAEPPAAVVDLARKLHDALVGRGFAPDLKPFRPHVTIARRYAGPDEVGQIQPVIWRFTDLALIQSQTLPEGALYRLVESYPL